MSLGVRMNNQATRWWRLFDAGLFNHPIGSLGERTSAVNGPCALSRGSPNRIRWSHGKLARSGLVIPGYNRYPPGPQRNRLTWRWERVSIKGDHVRADRATEG